MDLTPAGIQTAGPVFQKARTDGQVLRQKIDDLSAELDSVAARRSRRRNKPRRRGANSLQARSPGGGHGAVERDISLLYREASRLLGCAEFGAAGYDFPIAHSPPTSCTTTRSPSWPAAASRSIGSATGS